MVTLIVDVGCQHMDKVINIANKMRNVLSKITYSAALAEIVLIMEILFVFVERINNYVGWILVEIKIPKESVIVMLHLIALI